MNAKAFSLGMIATIMAFVIGCVALVYFGVQYRRERQREFMSECVEHRPRYECTYLWMSANRDRDDTPIIIPMPSGR